jgi:uncharacterized protein with GYD domain
MAHYLIQVAYTPEAWAAMTKNPQDRSEVIRPIVERMGGRVEEFYVSFGEYDIVAIVEFPDNVTAAAFSIGTTSGGALKAFKTTPLLQPDEALQAMRRAAEIGYEPPG